MLAGAVGVISSLLSVWHFGVGSGGVGGVLLSLSSIWHWWQQQQCWWCCLIIIALEAASTHKPPHKQLLTGVGWCWVILSWWEVGLLVTWWAYKNGGVLTLQVSTTWASQHLPLSIVIVISYPCPVIHHLLSRVHWWACFMVGISLKDKDNQKLSTIKHERKTYLGPNDANHHLGSVSVWCGHCCHVFHCFQSLAIGRNLKGAGWGGCLQKWSGGGGGGQGWAARLWGWSWLFINCWNVDQQQHSILINQSIDHFTDGSIDHIPWQCC